MVDAAEVLEAALIESHARIDRQNNRIDQLKEESRTKDNRTAELESKIAELIQKLEVMDDRNHRQHQKILDQEIDLKCVRDMNENLSLDNSRLTEYNDNQSNTIVELTKEIEVLRVNNKALQADLNTANELIAEYGRYADYVSSLDEDEDACSFNIWRKKL